MKATKELWAVELDISQEAGRPDYWVIHDEGENGYPRLCVYESKREAKEAAKGRDHRARVVRFVRADP